MFLAMVWWFAGARKWFKGPKVNLEHVMLGREEQVKQLQAEEVSGDSSSDSGSNEKS